jgi:hypothetical protein
MYRNHVSIHQLKRYLGKKSAVYNVSCRSRTGVGSGPKNGRVVLSYDVNRILASNPTVVVCYPTDKTPYGSVRFCYLKFVGTDCYMFLRAKRRDFLRYHGRQKITRQRAQNHDEPESKATSHQPSRGATSTRQKTNTCQRSLCKGKAANTITYDRQIR